MKQRKPEHRNYNNRTLNEISHGFVTGQWDLRCETSDYPDLLLQFLQSPGRLAAQEISVTNASCLSISGPASVLSVCHCPAGPAGPMGAFPFAMCSSGADWMMTVIVDVGRGGKRSAGAHNGFRFWGGNEM